MRIFEAGRSLVFSGLATRIASRGGSGGAEQVNKEVQEDWE